MNRRGFTLIELLVVISIIAVLSGMLMPIVSIANRSAATTNTQGLLRRIGTALEDFRTETGGYPYLTHTAYPDANRLAYHLAHDLDAAGLATLRAEADAAASRYDPSGDGSMLLTGANIDPVDGTAADSYKVAIVNQIHRMAATRARMAIFAGAANITGFKAFGGYDHSSDRLVPAATSRGWGADYLGGDLHKDEVSGEAIVDRWNTPLVYVCPLIPGVQGCFVPEALGRILSGSAAEAWNRPVQMHDPIDARTYGLAPHARSVTGTLASDIRITAASAWTMQPEIWSPGPDRLAAAQRNSLENKDNIATCPYLRGLE